MNFTIITFTSLQETNCGEPFTQEQRYIRKLFRRAKVEIDRICSTLHLPLKFQELLKQRFEIVFPILRPRLNAKTYGRRVDVLVPVFLFQLLKQEGYGRNIQEIYSAMSCTPKQFNSVVLSLELKQSRILTGTL